MDECIGLSVLYCECSDIFDVVDSALVNNIEIYVILYMVAYTVKTRLNE